MSGVAWALLAGVGFGLFQAVNRRAVARMEVLVAASLQLLVSVVILAGISVATEDLRLLASTTPATWINFALAGFIHFFVGWTFLNASQKKVGAARTSALIGTTPIFAVVVAALTLDEYPTLPALAGILVIVFGVFLVNHVPQPATDPPLGIVATRKQAGLRWQRMVRGLAAAISLAISPVFIRRGLQSLPSPVLGVTIGMTAGSLAFLVLLALRVRSTPLQPIPRDALLFKLLAGVLVGLSTWGRWVALALAPVAAVLALSLVSVLVVNLLAPLLVERHLERVTLQVWIGSFLIIAGSLVLIFLG